MAGSPALNERGSDIRGVTGHASGDLVCRPEEGHLVLSILNQREWAGLPSCGQACVHRRTSNAGLADLVEKREAGVDARRRTGVLPHRIRSRHA